MRIVRGVALLLLLAVGALAFSMGVAQCDIRTLEPATQRMAALGHAYGVGLVRMVAGFEAVRNVAAHPAESHDRSPPIPLPERGAGAVQEERGPTGLQVTENVLLCRRAGHRDIAGAADHVQDHQLVALGQTVLVEAGPFVLAKADVVGVGEALVEHPSRVGIVVVVRREQDHLSLRPSVSESRR